MAIEAEAPRCFSLRMELWFEAGCFRNNNPFLFATSFEGPFVKLGLTRSELIKAFGRPVRWETRTRGGV